ncbi:fibronectin type III domain-containing protein, partial [bacterium]|nr:fibronectin type III domain-containing protein [bacterium]
MASMISSMSSIINVSYGNTNPSTNIASIQLSTFLSAGPPTAPQNLLIYPITNSNATFSYTAPEYSDSTDYSSLLTIELYTITYSSPGSFIRYPSAISDTVHTLSNSTNLSYNATSLYPDSPYTFSVYAENTANINGPTVSTISTTSNLSPSPVLSGTLQFPSRFYSNGTIKNISTNTSVTNLVNSTTNWGSSPFITPINNIATRGLNGGSNVNLMNLSTILTTGTVSTIGPSILFNGFPAQTPSASTQNNITLTPNTVYDTYNTSSNYNKGFFLESQNSLTIGSNTFVASPYNYTINVLQFSTFSGSASFTYQYDGSPGTPSASLSAFNLLSNTSALVSGVNIIYGTPSFSVVTTASNLGTYYYTSPLLNYTNSITGSWSPSSEVTLSNIISGK